MNKSVIVKLVVCVSAAVLVGGCQAGRPSDAELIGNTMTDWKTALIAKDLDKVMAAYSENYVSLRGGGKDEVRQFMMTVFERGFMDNAKIALEEAQTTIEDDKAGFGPVKFTSDRGTFAVAYTLKKEDGAWRITGSKSQEQ
jgi:ketosteroid isomerase-like protein